MADTERALFFENRAGARLYGHLHLATQSTDGSTPSPVVVYCHPFGEEKMHAHRVAVHFARYAANAGVSVFRFDTFGSGDSDGLSEEATLRGMIEDTADAVHFVRDRLDGRRAVLLGLRLGANLAFQASCLAADPAGEADNPVAGVIWMLLSWKAPMVIAFITR